MKYLYLSVFLFTLLLTACRPDPTGDQGQEHVQEGTTTEAVTSIAKQAAMDSADNDGFVATPVLPDLNNNTVNTLISTYWVAEHWVDHADGTNNKPNKGRWWKFEADGTFTTGKWEKTLSHGSWVVYQDQKKTLLHLDAANDALNMEFEIQQIVLSGDYMSWVGTSTYKMARIAVKAISLLSVPTKAQFGFTD